MHALLDIPFAVVVWYVGALDSVPEYVRALVAGGLLALCLRLAQHRVPASDVQLSISFCKVTLIVLITIPVLVWLLPVSRVAVFVEQHEPLARADHIVWLAVVGLWSAGFLAGVLRLVADYLRTRAALLALPVLPEGDGLARRLAHWQRRLGDTRALGLVLAGTGHPRQLPGVRRVVLPRAVAHWPAPAQDLLMIQELCRRRKSQARWALLARFVACCYWPLPWARKLGSRLLDDFDVVTDNLAEACYMDDVGYRRALRQMEQRLAAPAAAVGAPPPPGRRSRAMVTAAVQGYRDHLAGLWSMQPYAPAGTSAPSAVHERRQAVRWAEPGERLVLLIGQAVLVAVVAGGATLRQVPPEIERDYSITLEDASWISTFYRDQERSQRRAHLDRESYPDGSE